MEQYADSPPSNVPLLDPVREMSEDDINRVINDFVKAAIRLKGAVLMVLSFMERTDT